MILERRYWNLSRFLVALMVIIGVSQVAQATTDHDDVMGDTVWFTNISENTKTAGDPEPLYGQPVALGDALDFGVNQFDFSAESNDAMVDTTDGALSLMIQSKDAYSLESITFDESGFVSLFTLDGDPFAAVSGLIEITINEIDGMPVSPINLPGIIPNFQPSAGDFQHSVDASTPFFTSNWFASTTIDLDEILVERQISFDFGVTKVSIDLDNFLLAAAGGVGSSAFIDKKSFSIDVETEPIPEPSTLLLAAFGLVAIAMNRSK